MLLKRNKRIAFYFQITIIPCQYRILFTGWMLFALLS